LLDRRGRNLTVSEWYTAQYAEMREKRAEATARLRRGGHVCAGLCWALSVGAVVLAIWAEAPALILGAIITGLSGWYCLSVTREIG
jgi:hypothetical protein